MRIDVHHFVHLSRDEISEGIPLHKSQHDRDREVLVEELLAVRSILVDLKHLILQVLSNQQLQEKRMTELTQEIADLTQDVEDETTVVESVTTLVIGAVSLIDELVGEIQNSAGDREAVLALAAKVKTHTASLSDSATKLGAAVSANTPAATPSPDAPPTPVEVPPTVQPTAEPSPDAPVAADPNAH